MGVLEIPPSSARVHNRLQRPQEEPTPQNNRKLGTTSQAHGHKQNTRKTAIKLWHTGQTAERRHEGAVPITVSRMFIHDCSLAISWGKSRTPQNESVPVCRRQASHGPAMGYSCCSDTQSPARSSAPSRPLASRSDRFLRSTTPIMDTSGWRSHPDNPSRTQSTHTDDYGLDLESTAQ
jgi:hypothetical protein